MATETKKPEAAAAAAPPIEARCLTLRQKLVEMRKACPEIVKKKHSEGVKYKYAKIYDVWEKITPIMNELGVDFEVIGEKATRYWSPETKETLVQRLAAYENTGLEPWEIGPAIEKAAKDAETATATKMAECIAGGIKDTVEAIHRDPDGFFKGGAR